MPRSSLREELTSRLHEYLAIAELHSPEEYPLDVKSVAVALNVSRTTLYKYALDEDIAAASQRQLDRAYNSGRRTRRNMIEEIMSELKARLHLAEERIKQLIARLAMVGGQRCTAWNKSQRIYIVLFLIQSVMFRMQAVTYLAGKKDGHNRTEPIDRQDGSSFPYP